jgi:DNA invertase Pin-like site-specific DNA recombinase
MTAYGYARVSTRGQARDGNSLEVQRKALAGDGCDEVVEETYTGTTTDRPELDRLLARMRAGDSLVVTKLDRIARSTVQGCSLVRGLIDRGVSVRVLNMGGVIDDTPMGRMVVSVMFAMAEFERDMIVERTREGRELARTRPGYRDGRPPKEVDPALLAEHQRRVGAREESVAEACRAVGVGRTKWYELRSAA